MALTWWAVGTWAVTAVGGLLMAAVFLRHNGMRQSEHEAIGPRRVFPHVGAAVVGFALWVAYAVTDNGALAWAATAAIGLAFLIAGTFLLTRDQHRRAVLAAAWRTRQTAAVQPNHRGAARLPAEQFIPVTLASAHGLLGAATLLLVLLNQAGLGGS
jgi:hypothetical protein